MDEKLNSKNDEFTQNAKESDYKNLLIRLKKISEAIALLKKDI